MTSDRLRSEFLNFFKNKKHKIIPSDSLVPQEDPTLLFTGAGMNQFKEQFLGKNVSYRRAATCQKCLRTADLEKVGKTAGHHTFFEMLGNFSFGDYFKKEAIAWAWEFLVDILKLPTEKLWVSVYHEDEEAFSIWKDIIKIEEEKIIKLGDKENFWPQEAKEKGPNGPCGPCSEIFYDWGQEKGCKKPDCSPACDCGRFVEIWNLVFTQFNRIGKGKLEDLPNKNIDTGMGLERLAAVTQGVGSNFEIDSFKLLVKTIATNVNYKYGSSKEKDSHINAIADHVRAITFTIVDGVRPSNEGRGFVVRKLVRKSGQRARLVGFAEPFLYEIIPSVAKAFKSAYPELTKEKEDIARVVLNEEQSVKYILDTELPRLEEDFLDIKKSGNVIIPGELLFKYYDEKGLPMDLIEEKAQAGDLRLDMNGFQKLLDQQKERSREARKTSGSIFVEKFFSDKKTEFAHDKPSIDGTILFMKKEGKVLHIALDKTVFYGESGGQVGDIGFIEGKGFKIEIENAKRYENTIDHIGKVIKGNPKVGDKIKATIDLERRSLIAKNHTATHLLHAALKKVLGKHVNQYGSLVAQDRLRFDFTHPSKLDQSQLKKIEDIVNEFIDDGHKVESKKMKLELAKTEGAIALFGEKYGDEVTVRSIGSVSKELCGGTHVKKTKEIGIFKIVNESSVASGVRRIEALTGEAVYSWMKTDMEKSLSLYKEALKKIASLKDKQSRKSVEKIELYLEEKLIKIDGVIEKDTNRLGKKDLDLWINSLKPEIMRASVDLNEESKLIQKRQKKLKKVDYSAKIGDIIGNRKDVCGIGVVSEKIEGADMDDLRSLMDLVKEKMKSGVIVLATTKEERVNIILGVTKDLVSLGMNADRIIKKVAGIVEGSGGGRPDLAQAGGKNPDKLDEALNVVFDVVKEERESKK